MLKIEIRTDGAAFHNPLTGKEDRMYESDELCRILTEVVIDLKYGSTGGKLFDYNGNKVGEWRR